jgi:hypothetical protein
MSKRTLGGLSSRLLEQVDGEENKEKKDEGKEDETEQKENPQLDLEDQDEEEETDEDITGFVKNPRKEKPKQEETHQRKTFLIEKDLLKWMKAEAKRYGHGFYVDFVNASLKLGKKRYEEAKKTKKNKSK